MSGLISFFTILVMASAASAAPGRDRPRELDRPKAVEPKGGQVRDVNNQVGFERTASRIAEEALQDLNCDGRCRLSAMAIEGMVRNPSSLELGQGEHTVAQSIARDVRAGQLSGLALPQAIQGALNKRDIEQEEFNEACGPR